METDPQPEIPAPPAPQVEPWTWLTDGKGVKVGDRIFAIAKGKQDALAAYLEDLKDFSEVRTILLTAKISFQRGAADYREAVDRLRDLLRGLDEVGGIMAEVTSSFGAFFDPPGILEALPPDPAVKTKFCNEALSKLANGK